MSATEAEKARIRQALAEGTNARGFSAENAAIYREVQSDDAPKPEPVEVEVEVAPVPVPPEPPPQPKRRIRKRKV